MEAVMLANTGVFWRLAFIGSAVGVCLGGCGEPMRSDLPICLAERVAHLTDVLEEKSRLEDARISGIYDAAEELGQIGLEHRLPGRSIAALARVANDNRVAMFECSIWGSFGGGLRYLNLDAARTAFLKWELKECADEHKKMQVLWRELSDEKGGAGIRTFCIGRFSEMTSAETIPYLLAAAADRDRCESWYVSVMAVRALGGKLPRSRDALLLLAESHSNAGLLAVDVLMDLDWSGLLVSSDDFAPLAARIRNRRWEVRRRAVASVAKDKPVNGLELLQEALGDSDCLVRQAAAAALGKLGDLHALAALKGACKDPSFLVRLSAYRSLGDLHAPAEVGLLDAAFDDPNSVVRRVALSEISRSRDEIDVPLRLQSRMLADPDAGVREIAVGFIAGLKQDVAESLFKAIEDREAAVRAAAARALGERKEIAGAERLVKALGDADGIVRIEAARALGERKERAAVERLCAMLKGDEAPSVRAVAAEVLGLIGGPACGQSLITALEDEYSDVRANAATALGSIGYLDAIEALRKRAQEDAADSVRKASTAALETILNRSGPGPP